MKRLMFVLALFGCNPSSATVMRFPGSVAPTLLQNGAKVDTLEVGQTIQLFRSKRLNPANSNLTWASSNTSAVTLSSTNNTSAIATGVAAGQSLITATTQQGKVDSARLVVIGANPPPAPVVHHVNVAPTTATIQSGGTQSFAATAFDSTNAVIPGRSFAWTSSATGVATIDANGLASAVGAGSTTITATTGGVGGTASLTVTSASACTLIKNWNAVTNSAFAMPGYLETKIEPNFGTRITRVSADSGVAMPFGLGSWGTVAGHGYAKESVWNADESILMLRDINTSGGWLFLDGATYMPLFRHSSVPGSHIPLWHPTQPDIMVMSSTSGQVGLWNVVTNTQTWLNSTTGYSGVTFGSGEGNLSADGQWVVILATRNSDGKRVAYAVNTVTGAKGNDIDLAAQGFGTAQSDVDWASISYGGGYIVVMGTISGTDLRWKAFNRSTLALTVYGQTDRMSHADFTLDASGNEVIAGPAAGGLYQTQWVSIRLDNGTKVAHSPATTWDWHASARAITRPGWIYGVTNRALGTSSNVDGEMYAVKLDGSQSVERYGRFRSNLLSGGGTDYASYPFFVPSKDGKRGLFRSNWGESDNRPVHAFVIDWRECS